MSGCMDVNSAESAAGGYSVKARLEELEEVKHTCCMHTQLSRGRWCCKGCWVWSCMVIDTINHGVPNSNKG